MYLQTYMQRESERGHSIQIVICKREHSAARARAHDCNHFFDTVFFPPFSPQVGPLNVKASKILIIANVCSRAFGPANDTWKIDARKENIFKECVCVCVFNTVTLFVLIYYIVEIRRRWWKHKQSVEQREWQNTTQPIVRFVHARARARARNSHSHFV